MSKTKYFTTVVQNRKPTLRKSKRAFVRSAYARHVSAVLGDTKRDLHALGEDFRKGRVTAGDRVSAAPGCRGTSDRQRSQRVPADPRLPVSAIMEVL